MCTYSWYTLLYIRHDYNIVKQLNSNNNFKKKTEIQKEVQPHIPLSLSPLPQTCVISYLFIINSFLLGLSEPYAIKHAQGSHVL